MCVCQFKDCHRGAVIEGLDSVFTRSVASSLQVALQAVNNRKHIYVVNLTDSYTAVIAREKMQQEAEGKTCTQMNNTHKGFFSS